MNEKQEISFIFFEMCWVVMRNSLFLYKIY